MQTPFTDQPTVDVVIPNYNYGHYLLECADSVLSQTGVNVRLLIIDNASEDNSAAIARDFAAHDKRIELLLRSKNAGPHASFNEGIDWARSEYFLILCADDLLAHGALSRAIHVLEQCPDAHLAYGATQKISKDEKRPQRPTIAGCGQWNISSGTDFIELACKHAFNPVAGPTAVVRTSVQKQAGYYRRTLPHTDDLEMWLRMALLGNVASTETVQAYARVHSNNQSAKVAGIMHWNREFEAGFRSFFENDGRDMPQAKQYLAAACDCLTKRAYWSAWSNLVRREEGSVSLMTFALKRHPLMALMPPFDYLFQRRRRLSP
ncbi:glycosyl transferase [Ochrobactrum sp. MYb15]|uniref:glycosyltransferase n=1 Tax=Brucella pituitosa TaxID=571256 RepID=UPI000CFC3A0A|nr:glycosyl transferase [Ochrobactrum sp. MYb19]PRA63450.1 glycosyl transferase [Ochrobactrum sp. MYb18]PRA73660.1 glycosyl transferase [Brucella thiophenivorans]PRA88445.1 glycosyl transferase [Ochrobactrum sp. MYb14]PRA94717.1 glycosyl transferase [Ochrobactrum sp. MYb15]